MTTQQQPAEQGREAAQRAQQHAQAAATAAASAAGAAAEAVTAVAQVASTVAAEKGRAAYEAARDAARERDLRPVPVVLEGVVEEAIGRGADAWDALRGRPRRSRRWPWATGAAVAGAVVGAVAAVVVSRVVGRDEPGAQEPEDLQAVVDTPPASAAVPPGGVVDEDGEAVLPEV